MDCLWLGANPLPEPMLSQFTDAYMRHRGNELDVNLTNDKDQ